MYERKDIPSMNEGRRYERKDTPSMNEGCRFVRLQYRGTISRTEIVEFLAETPTHYKVQFTLSGRPVEALYRKEKWEIVT